MLRRKAVLTIGHKSDLWTVIQLTHESTPFPRCHFHQLRVFVIAVVFGFTDSTGPQAPKPRAAWAKIQSPTAPAMTASALASSC